MKSSYQKRKDEIKKLEEEIANYRTLEHAFIGYVRGDLLNHPQMKKEALNCLKNHTTMYNLDNIINYRKK